jgi:hypothetical protein
MVESVQLRTAANEPDVDPRETASQDQRGGISWVRQQPLLATAVAGD